MERREQILNWLKEILDKNLSGLLLTPLFLVRKPTCLFCGGQISIEVL